MSDQLEKLLAQKPMKKPAKAWRNWWKAAERAVYVVDGKRHDKGAAIPSIRLYPSKDVAESDAPQVAAYNRRNGFSEDIYLGAFPEGERP